MTIDSAHDIATGPFAGGGFRSLAITDVASVATLNDLFRVGWRVIAVNVDGVSYLPAVGARGEMSVLDRRSRVDVVLAAGDAPARQSALFLRKDRRGRVDLDRTPIQARGWTRSLQVVTMGGDGIVLYQREA